MQNSEKQTVIKDYIANVTKNAVMLQQYYNPFTNRVIIGIINYVIHVIPEFIPVYAQLKFAFL